MSHSYLHTKKALNHQVFFFCLSPVKKLRKSEKCASAMMQGCLKYLNHKEIFNRALMKGSCCRRLLERAIFKAKHIGKLWPLVIRWKKLLT